MIKISVIMSIYNTNHVYVKEAISSIVNQRYGNFEFIIIDDGSDLDYQALIDSFKDKRIIFLKKEHNKGLAYCLNRAIEIAKCDYIARMDADDISLHNRFSEMIYFMENNKEIDIAGSFYREIGFGNQVVKLENKDEYIKPAMLFYNPIAHPTVFFRASSVEKYNIRYPEEFYPEDYYLWVKCSLFHESIKFANVPRILLYYRLHNNQETVKKKSMFLSNSKEVTKKIFNRLNLSINEYEFFIFEKFKARKSLNSDESKEIFSILYKIISANKKYKLYQPEALEIIIANEIVKRIILGKLRPVLQCSPSIQKSICSIWHIANLNLYKIFRYF